MAFWQMFLTFGPAIDNIYNGILHVKTFAQNRDISDVVDGVRKETLTALREQGFDIKKLDEDRMRRWLVEGAEIFEPIL